MPIDASIPLGFKPPEPMQGLSSLLGVANSVQTLQQNQQKTQQGSIDLQERQAMQRVLSDPANYTDESGNFDLGRAQSSIMRAAPTTGTKYMNDLAVAHTASTNASHALNSLTAENRAQIGSTLAALPENAPPELVEKTVDALGKQYGGRIDPLVSIFKQQYKAALQQGPDKAREFVLQSARGVLPQETQQTMNTPSVAPVDTGATSYGVNVKPGVAGLPVGAVVPGTSVQKTVPPTQPVVGPNNQPGIIGPHGTPPKAGTVPSGYAGGSPQSAAPEQLRIMQEERAKAASQGDQATVAALDREMARITAQSGVQPSQPAGFVPTAPAPGANESKIGSVQVVNDHWTRVNAGAADAPVATSLLSTIKQLAPGAITGTEAGKRSYWNGLFNALHLGTQSTGDLQKDTDLLQKAMAQLNLATPATTDAMRTLVEAGRPHSTMSEGAIKDAAAQIEGQIKANMAMRNLLAPDKQYANATGDVSHYEQKRQVLEPLMDPRIFQYESMPKEERKQFMSKLNPHDRTALIEKTKKLEAMGIFK